MSKRKAKVVMVAGFPATGKSMVAKISAGMLNAAYLDKDITGGPLVEAALEMVNHDRHDRDNPPYTTHLKEADYQTLYDSIWANVRYGSEVTVASAPFLSLLNNPEELQRFMKQAQRYRADLIFVWVETSLEFRKAQMERRNAQRDREKLANWSEYARTVSDRPPLPEGISFVINNDDRDAKELFKDLEGIYSSLGMTIVNTMDE